MVKYVAILLKRSDCIQGCSSVMSTGSGKHSEKQLCGQPWLDGEGLPSKDHWACAVRDQQMIWHCPSYWRGLHGDSGTVVTRGDSSQSLWPLCNPSAPHQPHPASPHPGQFQLWVRDHFPTYRKLVPLNEKNQQGGTRSLSWVWGAVDVRQISKKSVTWAIFVTGIR